MLQLSNVLEIMQIINLTYTFVSSGRVGKALPLKPKLEGTGEHIGLWYLRLSKESSATSLFHIKRVQNIC